MRYQHVPNRIYGVPGELLSHDATECGKAAGIIVWYQSSVEELSKLHHAHAAYNKTALPDEIAATNTAGRHVLKERYAGGVTPVASQRFDEIGESAQRVRRTSTLRPKGLASRTPRAPRFLLNQFRRRRYRKSPIIRPAYDDSRLPVVTSMINRYYDPSTDQFLSIDPDVAETDQPYAFVNDDPLNASDATGLLACSGSKCAKSIPKLSVKVTIKDTIPKGDALASYSAPGVTVKISTSYDELSGVTDNQEFVYHYTSLANAKSILEDGAIKVPDGEDGQVYFTPDQYSSGADAQSGLALSNEPDGYFQIPLSRIVEPSDLTEVAPANGFGGGGLEGTSKSDIDIDGLEFTPF